MQHPRTLLLTTAVALSIGGCEPEALPETAAETLDFAFEELATRQDPGVLWDLLPPSYQLDVREWCRDLSAALPRDEYDKTFAVIRKTGAVLKEQSDFIAAITGFKMALKMFGNIGEDDLAAALTATGDVFLILGGSKISTLQGLETMDPGEFLHDTGRRMGRSAIRAARVTGRDPIASASKAKIELVSSKDNISTLRFRIEGQVIEIDFMLVEDRWIPVELEKMWKDTDAQVRVWIRSLDLKTSADRVKILDELLADLDKFKAATSRSKFDRLMSESISKYQKLLK